MNKPDIRFNGFDEEWEEKNYKEVFDTSVSNNTLSRAELTSERTSTKNVHYGDILIKYNSILYANKDDFPFIPETVKVDSKNFLKDGDIVFADTAEDETCGKATELNNIDNEKLVAGFHTFVARLKLQFQSKYLGYFINSPAYHNQLFPYMQGTKVTSISKTSIQKTWINFPSPTEQSKIGSLFSQIDSLIASTQKEHDKLVTLKKCMLQKMFPKPRHSELDSEPLVPEIRFKGFTGNWEEKRLGEFGDVCMCKRIFKEQTSDKGDIPFYKIGTFGGIADSFISKTLFEEYKNNYPYPQKGAILISASGSIGRTVIYQGKDEYFQDSNIVWLEHNDNILDSFLKILYDNLKWNGIEGTTIKRLYNNNILNQRVTVPSLPEQQKIGAYFQNLDNLISKQSAELEKLKNVKKTLLSKMFV